MKKLILVIIIVSSILSGGCIAVKSQNSGEKTKRDYLVYNLGEFPSDLIMLNKDNTRQQDLLVALFEGLVRYSGVSNSTGKDSVVPGIAKSWSLSKDETVYTFNLRENACWSDGSKITAYDFADFFYNLLKPGQYNLDDYELFYISGAKKYREGKSGSNGLAVKAIDINTLEIRLDYPCSFFLDILAQPIYGIRKFQDNLTTWKNDYKSILFSGPFKIKALNDTNEIELEKNNKYWNSESIISSKIMLTSITGGEECFTKFQKNQVDLLINPPESEIEELTKEGSIEAVPSIICSYLAFNLKRENINQDAELRKTMAYAVNKSNINTLSGNTKTTAAFAFKPSTQESNINKKVEEKTSNKKTEGVLKLIYRDTQDNENICRTIEDNAVKVSGIKIKLYPLDEAEFTDALKKGDYDMAKIDSEGDFEFPIIFLQKLVFGSEFNSFGYNNAAYNKLIKEYAVERKKPLRAQYLQKAQNLISEDVPLIPLYYYETILCKKTNVTGIAITKKGNIILDRAGFVNN